MSITINAESGATVNVYEGGSDHESEVGSADSEETKGSKESEGCSECNENENEGSSGSSAPFTHGDLTDLAGLEVKEYPKGEGLDFIQELLNLDGDQMAGLLKVFDTDGEEGLSEAEVEVMKTVLEAIFKDGVPDDGVSVEMLQQYMDELGGDSEPKELNITNSRTLTGLMGLDEKKSYTAEDLMKAVPSLTEENAEALVAQFDQDGDGELNPAETTAMKDAVTAAVFDGGFNDKKLSSDDISSYLSQDATLDLMGLPLPGSEKTGGAEETEEEGEEEEQKTDTTTVAPYTAETLMAAAPGLTQKNADDLIALFDADGSGDLDAAEVGTMKGALQQAQDDGQMDDSYELLSVKDLEAYMKPATPVTSEDIQKMLDDGGEYKFTYNEKEYSIKKAEDGSYKAYDGDKVVDEQVQINNDSTVEGFVEVGGLEGLAPENRVYIGSSEEHPKGVILEASAELDKNDTVAEGSSHLATLLSTGKMVTDFSKVEAEETEGTEGATTTALSDTPPEDVKAGLDNGAKYTFTYDGKEYTIQKATEGEGYEAVDSDGVKAKVTIDDGYDATNGSIEVYLPLPDENEMEQSLHISGSDYNMEVSESTDSMNKPEES